jgi:hypothetical protein
MNELDLLQRLGAQTQAETGPPIDVAAAVIQRLAGRPSRTVDRRLAVVTACACGLSVLAMGAAWLSRPAHDTVATLSEAVIHSTGPEALLSLLEPDNEH